jgi:hypothetical protein
MSAIDPWKTMNASAVPSPNEKLRPAVPESVKVPLTAVSVTSSRQAPASGSEIEILFGGRAAEERTSDVSSSTDCGPGR